MVLSMIRAIIARLRPTPPLSCKAALWTAILQELRERGGGHREAGGFLLGIRDAKGRRRITEFMAYDDIDPKALQGIIVFDGSKMDLVWKRCAAAGLQVVADVHTHPGGYGQSDIDQANPMIPERGHIALIIPNFVDHDYLPGQIGLHEYRGRDGWLDHSAAAKRFFRVDRW